MSSDAAVFPKKVPDKQVTSIAFSMRISVQPDVLIREVGGESVILDLKTERYLGLNGVGTEMWKALTTSDSIQAAFEHLLAEYDVDPEVLRRDLHDLIEKLIEHGLVTASKEQESR
jgi:hypothetical protein